MREEWIFLKSPGNELVQIDLFEVDHPIVGGAFFSASFITCSNSFRLPPFPPRPQPKPAHPTHAAARQE